ncbi:hypothetical protein V5L05_003589, partial [Enterobacter cloacae]
ENIDLIDVGTNNSHFLIVNKNQESDIKGTLVDLIDKYSSELERISGTLEIYQELMMVMPNMKKEFKQLSVEQQRRYIRTNEKINTLKKIVGKPYSMI